MREGEEVVVEAEGKGGDDEVSGDEEVAKQGPYGLEREGSVERGVPGVLPPGEWAGPRPRVVVEEGVCVGVERAMLGHAARRNLLAAVASSKDQGPGVVGRERRRGPRDKVIRSW